MNLKRLLTLMVPGLIVAAGANAAIVSVDVAGNAYNGPGVLDASSHLWLLKGDGSNFTLDSQTVALSLGFPSAGSAGTPGIGLFAEYVHNGGGAAVPFTLSGLNPAQTYDIVIYSAQSGGWNRGGAFQLTTYGSYGGPASQQVTGAQQDTFAPSVNYVSFSGITPNASGTIGFQCSNGSGIGLMNGFEIQSVPEPGAWMSLLGGCGVLLGLRRRRLLGVKSHV
jgi:hypothetical protein